MLKNLMVIKKIKDKTKKPYKSLSTYSSDPVYPFKWTLTDIITMTAGIPVIKTENDD